MKLFIFLPLYLYACGLTLHVFMSDRAVEESSPGLKKFMTHQKAAYRSGTLFPDTGHTQYGQNTYGESVHWAPFLNSYKSYIAKYCESLTESCKETFAHFLGSLAHTLGDIEFDGLFMTEAKKRDGRSSGGQVGNILDATLDFIALEDHPFLTMNFSKKIIPKNIESIVSEHHRVSRSDIVRGHKWVWGALIGERMISETFASKYRPYIPWSADNYMDAPGGVYSTGKKIASVWEEIWNLVEAYGLLGLKKFEFYNKGSWPMVDFGIKYLD